jgi:integrase
LTFDGHDLRAPGYFGDPQKARDAAVLSAAEYDHNAPPRKGERRRLSYYASVKDPDERPAKRRWPANVDEETKATHQERVRCFIRLTGWDPYVDDMTRPEVEAALEVLVVSGLAPTYIGQVMGSVRALLNRLVALEMLRANVGDGVTLTADQVSRAWDSRLDHDGEQREDGVQFRFGETTPPHAVSRRDFRVAVAHMSAEGQVCVRLVVSSGARAGELPFLDLANADAETQALKIIERMTRDGRRRRGTKTTFHRPPGKDHRTTIIPKCLVSEIEGLGIRSGEPMFRAPRGGLLNLNNFRNRVLRPAMDAARAQLDEDAGFVPWGLKDLRHTFATELLAANVPFTHVSYWMGHHVNDHGNSPGVITRIPHL